MDWNEAPSNEVIYIHGFTPEKYAVAQGLTKTGLAKNFTQPFPAGKYSYEVKYFFAGNTYSTIFIGDKLVYAKKPTSGETLTLSGTVELDTPLTTVGCTTLFEHVRVSFRFYHFKITRTG